MHSAEREALILSSLKRKQFVSYRDLESQLDASPATIRRDLARLEAEEKLQRVHGGAKVIDGDDGPHDGSLRLTGTPFEKSLGQNIVAKRLIGRAAASLCTAGEGIMIDGGTTTYQMCDYLEGLRLQVLTNSLHIVNALLPQEDTQVIVPSGTIFREQNIILAPAGEASMPRFHGPKLFMGAAAVGPQGVMQADAILVASQRRLIERAEQVIVLVDSSKFTKTSGAIVCGLDEIDLIITDKAIPPETQAAIERAGCAVQLCN